MTGHRVLGFGRPGAYAVTMQSFIDLEGVSGATYRFHHVGDLANLPAIAGNFVYVLDDGPKPTVVCCGADETLLNAAQRWPSAQLSHGAKGLYVRKNVSWRTRASEHEDIVQRYRPTLVAAAEFDRKPS